MKFFAPLILTCALAAPAAFGQTVVVNESFEGTTTGAGWSFGGSGYTPVLTAAQGIDPTGSGWLRLTSNAGNEATYAVDTNSFASRNATIAVSFNYASYNGSGADGITFFLADASKTFGVGAYGGSLGYAQKTAAGGGGADINGMNGGYIGVGIDEFGNFSNPSEGRIGGPGSTPNAIAVRGPGSGLTGYNYLGGTGNLGANSIAFPSSTTRPTGANMRSVEIIITATNQMTVYLSSGGGAYQPLYTIDLSGFARPDSLIMGFTSGTGGSTDVHEIQNVSLSSVTANLWTAGGGDTQWGTGNNWFGGGVPAASSDILLDNTYVSTAQNINLGGATRTVRNVQIDAPFAYNLSNGTIAFDANGVLGPSGIFVTSTHGSANQTINANLTAANAIEIQNASTGTLALGGTLANGGNAVTFSGSGNTTESGVVSGTGGLVKNDAGNLTLSGANTYSGGTTLNDGTLTANNNTALGTGTVVLDGGTLASTTSATVNNALTLSASSGLSGITTSGTLTQTASSTLTLANATQSGAVNLSNTNTAQTLTAEVDSGTSTISGVIQNGGTGAGALTKTGAGTLVLSGANTYTGATTISAGTLQLGANNVLSNSSALNVAGGTLNLNKFSDAVGNLSFSNNGTIDFGSGGSNSFVFNNAGTTSGVLTIADYNSASNFFGTNTSGLSAAFLNSLYFSGFGAGATEAAATSNAGNGLGNAFKITPKAITWNVWKSNSSTAWGTTGNWSAGSVPNAASAYAEFGTGTQGSVVLGANRTVGGIRFDSTGPTAYTISGTNSLTFNNGASPAFIQQQSANNETISNTGGVVLSGNLVADVTGTGNLTISGAISGANSITKVGTGGKLVLSGNNTFTGGVAVNNGVVQGQSSNAFGTGTVSVANGAAVELSGGISPANAMNLAGTGVSNGGALRNISGNNTASGTLTLSADTRINSDAGTLTLSGTTSGTTQNLNLGGAGNITVSGHIATGTGGVTVDGSGTVTYSGGTANTYTGDTTVNSGTLALSGTANVTKVAGNLVVSGGTVNQTTSGQIATASTVTVNSGTYSLGASATQTLAELDTSAGSTTSIGTGATLTLGGTTSNNIAGTVSGAGALNVSGTGTTYLLGNNTYSGGTTTTTSVRVNSNTALGTGAVTVNSGGNVQLQNGVTLANNFTLNSSGSSGSSGAIENFAGSNTVSGNITLAGASTIDSTSGSLAVTGGISGANALTFSGSGNTTVSGVINNGAAGITKTGTGNLTLSGANTFTGPVAVNAGTLTLGASNTLPTGLSLTLAGAGTLDVNGKSNTIASLNGSGTVNMNSGALTLTGTSSYSGGVTGAGSLTLNSGSALTLGSSITNSSLNVTLAGGTLDLNAANFSLGTLNVTASSTLDFSATNNVTLNLANLVLAAGVTLTITNWQNTLDDFYTQAFAGATLDQRGSAPMNQIVFSGFSGNNTAWQSFDHQITPVPEPSFYGALLMLALGGLIAWRRRVRV
ncbi:MAG TPA: autotransporter-associated beta strand repeat-containing protein [Candidatus Didemnitutus sp.]|nr:autotransporter-associated beta strand repeat-containing protein [Candidatus Didemnitutus sp.]